jgi:hypothetical protein
MAMGVDEAGRERQPRAVDLRLTARAGQIAQPRDAIAPDGEITPPSRRAGSVDEIDAAEDEVVVRHPGGAPQIEDNPK